MSEKQRNYSEIYEHKEEAFKLLEELKACGAIRPLSEAEKTDPRTSRVPIKLLKKKSGKFELLAHFLGNACYEKVKFILDSLEIEAPNLAKIKSATKTDLKSAYAWEIKTASDP